MITSQADPSDYELPSTGGAGTKLYTAGGGALMLAALVCGVCKSADAKGGHVKKPASFLTRRQN